MKVVARKDACAGHARCAAIAPEIYELDDVGYIGFIEKEVPPGLEQLAIRGARSCPERVLRVLGDDGEQLTGS